MWITALVACTNPTPAPTDPVPTSGDYGTTDVCNTPGGDFGDFGTTDVLLVHGAGADELALALQVQGWFQNSFPSMELVEAGALTAAQRTDFDLFILGGSQNNPVLTELNGELPVRFDADSFEFGRYTWDNPGHGIALIHPNPWNTDHHLLVYGGTTTNGAASLFSIPTGGLDFHIARGRALEMEGRLCRDGDAWTFFDRRADDLHANWLEHTASLLTVQSDNHVFHYASGSSFDADKDWMPDWQEERFDRILSTLEVADLGRPIHWYLYETNAEKGRITGNDGNGNANNRAFEVHAVYGPTIQAVGAHEDVHVVQQHRIGDTEFALWGEGMAVMVDDTWQGTPLDEWASMHLQQGDLPALNNLLDDFWGTGGGSDLGYGAGGSFNRFLIDAYGATALKLVYSGGDASQALFDATGKTVSELEVDWHASLPAAP